MPYATPIELSHVWKRYYISSQHDSLRDAIPSLLKRWIGRDGHKPAEEGFWALKDVSFEVRRGETVGIIGHNGAGKSTILKLLSRIIRQTRGTAAVHGRLAALIELGGGFHPDLSGAENIYLQGTMLGLPRREVARVYDDIVAFSELDKFLEMPVKRYSSGMVVRLGFAIAAQVRPEVMLIDEVLAVGDLAFQQKCFRQIGELRQRGTTMIFISHNLEAVQKLCDRVLWLEHGQVQAEGVPAWIVRQYRTSVLSGSLKSAESRRLLVQGNGPLQIRNVALLGKDGAPIEALEMGEPLRIEVSFSATRPIEQPEVRISLERLDGLLCHATSTRSGGLLAERLEGEGTVTLEYPTVNLLPNLYQVTVEMFEANNPVPLTAVRQGCYFQIDADPHEQGAVHLDHVWALRVGARQEGVSPRAQGNG